MLSSCVLVKTVAKSGPSNTAVTYKIVLGPSDSAVDDTCVGQQRLFLQGLFDDVKK